MATSKTAWDHPRIRGEHVGEGLIVVPAVGSSPHTRGAPQLGRRPPRRAGIIPAYAGSTRRRRRPRSPCLDHPRIRGEHNSTTSECATRSGSSPHTRGARIRKIYQDRHSRIIPAYAGSTRPWSRSPGGSRDHPRIRGEHPTFAPPIDTNAGSSPHTRGARGPHPRWPS